MVQTIGSRLVKTIERQAHKISYFCVAENIPANQAVHELRRSFKRLRALLRFFNTIPDSQAITIHSAIRDFGKHLAPIRESAVNVDIFEKEVLGNKLIPEKKLKNAREMLVQKNRLLLESGFRENRLQLNIHHYFQNLEDILSEKSNELPTRGQFVHEIHHSFCKSYFLCHQLPASPHPEELHELRKKLKRLGYQLDFARFLYPRYCKLKTDQLNKITDQLGDDHDFHVFAEEFRRHDYGFDQEEIRIIENLADHLRELNQQKLYLRLRQFFTVFPDEFEEKLEKMFRLRE